MATAWPSAASVGARMAATSATSSSGQPGSSRAPATKPRPTDSGRPSASIRVGQRWARIRARASVRAASENSTTASAISATMSSLASSAWGARPTLHSPRPRPRQITGMVSGVSASRRAVAA